MEDTTAVASPRIRSLRNRTQKCRVCLKKSKEMVNIFDISPEHCVPIADLLSQYTGLEIFKGDSYPETICPSCLQAAKNAFEFMHYPEAIIDITQDESGVQVKNEGIENVLEKSAPQMEYFLIDEFLSDEVKPEQTGKYFPGNVMNEEPPEEYFPGQVINEPIDNDLLGEDVGESLDYEIDPSYLREQIWESNSFAFQCSFCLRRFRKSIQLKLHEYRHKMPTYKCSYCTESFIYQSLLQQHIRKHTGERPFKCSQCQKDFTTQQQFTIHFKSHPQIPMFKCSHCGLVFSNLEEHEAHIKTHDNKELFKCSVESCQREFNYKKALKNHITLYHITKKSIKCSHCQKDFSTRRELTNHIKISHKKNVSKQLFNCLHCKKTFKRNQSLLSHVKCKHRDA